MEPPTLRNILGQGWTYCPRCQAESMVTQKDGWHCPFCGITVILATPTVQPSEMMLWSEGLTGDELARETAHIQAQATKWIEAHKDIKPPNRLVWFSRITRPIAWLCGCKVVGLLDKKTEVTK